MKRFIPCLAIIALVALVGCSGDSPSARPVPTVVPTTWGIESLTVSDTTPFVGSPVLVEVEVTRDGSAAPDGTSVELASSGPGTLFGFTSGVLTKSDLVLNEDATVITEDGVASVFFAVVPVDENDDPSGSYLIQARVNNVVTQTTIAYSARPTTDAFQLLSVNPDRGPYTGAQVVTLYGVNISTPVEVYFIVNGRPYEAEVLDIIVGTDGWIQVLTPVFTGQDWSIEQTADIRATVSVGGADQQTDTLLGAYTLLQQSQTAGPVIYGVTPNAGRSSGGEVVSIVGQGFGFAAANMVVEFTDTGGTTRLGSILAVSPDGSQIQVETPRFSTLPLDEDEPQDVEVTTPNGSGTLANGFIVLADEPQPEITAISPTSGPLDGGTLVTIFGSGFQVPMQVWFGDLTALDVNVFNDTTAADNDRITCVTPDYSQQDEVVPVTVDVKTTNMTSGKESTLTGAFTYGDVLFISGNTPTEGGLGDLVIIYGSGFEDPLQVFLGDELMEVRSVSGTELVIRIPDDLATQCTATNGSFRVVLLESNLEVEGGNFTILGNTPKVLSVDPVILQETGTTPSGLTPNEITINGQQFADEVLVTVGNYVVPSGNIDRVSDTTIDVINLPGPDDLLITFDTAPCTTTIGQSGFRQVATPVSVGVTNFPGNCADTLFGAIVVEPFDQTCVLASGISLSVLTFPPTEFPGPSLGQTLTISETSGVSDLTVFNLSLTGRFFFDAGCSTQFQTGPINIPAGTSNSTYSVFFCPDQDNGASYVGSLNVLSSAPNSPTTQSLNAQETFPVMAVSPTSLIFTASGVAGDQSFTITNNGTANLGYTLSGLPASGFSIVSGGTTPVAPSGNTTVTVRYTGASPSTSTDSLTVTATNPDAQGSPATVTLDANVP